MDDYWAGNPAKSKQVISADQIMSLYIYIILKAKVKKLGAHLRIIYEFARQTLQQGSFDYYITTMEACISQIAQLSPEMLQRLVVN